MCKHPVIITIYRLKQQCECIKVDRRLPGEGNSNAHGARPVHQIISMIKCIWTSRVSIKNCLSLQCECESEPPSKDLPAEMAEMYKPIYSEDKGAPPTIDGTTSQVQKA